MLEKRVSLRKHVLSFLFFIYCVAVISVTLFPLPVQKSVIEIRRSPNYPNREHNFMPIADLLKIVKLADFRTATKIIGGNILLFIPLGLLLPVLTSKLNSLKAIILCGFLGSCIIEGLQLLISCLLGFNYRSVDVDDIILNTFGAVIGFWLLRLIMPQFKKRFVSLIGSQNNDT